MNLAHKNLALKAVSLPNSTGIGNPDRGNGQSPTPGAPGCMFPLLCPTQSPGTGGPAAVVAVTAAGRGRHPTESDETPVRQFGSGEFAESGLPESLMWTVDR